MISKKEVLKILLATLILGFVVAFPEISTSTLVYALASVFIILAANTLAKKMSAFYLDSEIEVGFWEVERYGFKPRSYFKRPVIAGIFVPVILVVASLGYLKWMASLIFEIKPQIHRAAKRHGIYSFSEITENHLGLVASAGIFFNFILAIIAYFIGFDDFAKISIYYIFFNMLPLSDLDGNKIFFGSMVLWSFLVALTLIGLAYVFLVV
ncbi:MAG TPA: hypothetical protein VJZ93_00970 [Candidatus Nanoarchaeia archaeon]|nr:hypothetical protein [Candidatus Nanoarchaeia archaeon]